MSWLEGATWPNVADVWPVIGFDDVFSVAWKAALVVVGTMLLAVLWGLFGPAKKPKGPAPAYAEAAPAAPVDDTRYLAVTAAHIIHMLRDAYEDEIKKEEVFDQKLRKCNNYPG